MSRELEREIRSKLDSLVNGKAGTRAFTHLNIDPTERDAIDYLHDVGALDHLGTGSFRVTAYGREYWEKLTAPRWYWFRLNWFLASVAGATILVSVVAAVANIVNLAL